MAEMKKLQISMINYYGVIKKACLTIFFLLSIISFSFAQDVLMAWDFDTYSGDEATGTATTVLTNISSTSPSGEIQRGAGLIVYPQEDRYNSRDWGISDLATAITENDYVYFTITPQSGYQITVSSIVFNYQNFNGPEYLTLRSSVDSYATDLNTQYTPNNNHSGVTMSFSGIENISSAVTFRIYGYQAQNVDRDGGFEGTGDDLIIYGTVSVIQDSNSEVNAPTSQVTGTSISSLATSSGSAVDVFSFSIEDLGTTDGQDTKVTNIRVTPGASNTTDWTDHIQGVTLSDGSPVTIGTPDIQDTYIDLPITAGDLDITDNTNTEVTLAVYLNTSNIVDNAILSFLINASSHGFTAENSGSLFADPFSGGNVSSNDFTIDVNATELQFSQQPTDVLQYSNITPAVTVGFTDVNGNVDIDYETVDIEITAIGATLIGSPITQAVQSNGLAQFSSLAFSPSGTTTLTASDVGAVLPATDISSNSFEVIPVGSVIQAVASSEASSISSIINDATITSVSEGEQVWQIDLFDGDGTNSDGDGLPTNYTSIQIDQHVANEIGNWQSAILAAGFFEGSTHIPGIVTINQTNISFTPSTTISVTHGAGSSKTISLRISLQTNLPVGVEGSKFVFEVYEGIVTVEGPSTSSQLGTFSANSSSTANGIDIEATKLILVQQPTDVLQGQNITPPVTVGFSDANNNIDVDYETADISITASGATLVGSPVNTAVTSNGLAEFPSLNFSSIGTTTLTATDIGDYLGTSANVVSNSFEVLPLCVTPSATTALITSSIEATSLTLSWTNGDGENRYAVMNSTNSFTNPVDDVAPPASAVTAWQNAGEQIIYIGTGSSVAITNLGPGNTYYFRVYEYNCSGTSTKYNTTDNVISSNTNLLDEKFVTCPTSNWTTILLSGNQWTCNSGYASVTGIGGGGTSDTWFISPLLDFSLMANEALTFESYTSGTDDAHPKLEVKYSTNYSGSGNPNGGGATWTELSYNYPAENSSVWSSSGTVSLAGIPDGNAYVAFRYSSSGEAVGAATEWRIRNILIDNAGCVTPSVQPSGIVFSNVTDTEMTVSWANGNGSGRLVIIREGSAVATTPTNGIEYNPGTSIWNDGDEIVASSGEYAVYSAGGNSIAITGLTKNRTYHIAVYEYNCAGINTYNTTAPLIGSQLTLSDQPTDITSSTTFVAPTNINYILNTTTPLILSNSVKVAEFDLNDYAAAGGATGFSGITFSLTNPFFIQEIGLFDELDVQIGATQSGAASVSFTVPDYEVNNGSRPFSIRVVFNTTVNDNQQFQFTITSVTPTAGTTLISPDAGGAQSSVAGDDNRIEVNITEIAFTTVPTDIYTFTDFQVDVKGQDNNNNVDLDATNTVTLVAAAAEGLLASDIGISQQLSAGILSYTDLYFDKENPALQIIANSTGLSSGLSSSINCIGRTAYYSFTGATGLESTFPPDRQPNYLTLSNYTKGTDLLISTIPTPDVFQFQNWSQTGAIEDDFFIEFTATPISTNTMTLTDFVFDGKRSLDGPQNLELRSSLDSYGSALGAVNFPSDALQTGITISLGASFTDLNNPVTFRLYGYDAADVLGTFYVDNVGVWGTISILSWPEFNSGYPTYNQPSTSGFDLTVNLDDVGSAYYVVVPANDPLPTETQIKAGQNSTGVPALANGNIIVPFSFTDVVEIVNDVDLLSDNLYDVHWVLSNGTNDSPRFTTEDVPTSDTDTDISMSGITQPLGSISSTADNSADSVAVFTFDIIDAGSFDGSPTQVTKLFFLQSQGSTVGYDGVVAGARLYNDTESSSIAISNTTISSSSLEIDIPLGELTIGDNTTERVTLFVWLNNTVPDNESIDFEIGGFGHGCQTYAIGSQFEDILNPITSESFTIDVDADSLYFSSVPASVADNTTPFSVSVQAIDQNGNIDSDETASVTLSEGIGTGTLSSVTGLSQSMSGGSVSWTNLLYDAASGEVFSIIATDDAANLAQTESSPISFSGGIDLIVTSGSTITITGTQSFTNVTVEDGGTLNLALGETLEIAGDFSIDGATSVYNDLGGTTSFNGGGAQSISSDETDKTVNFYNIDITNSSTVTNNIHINLINTLKLDASVTFDADGSTNRNFTLISTPSATARIDVIEDGATLSGNVVWQRSLRTGPQGWRYVGTPIKGQTVAQWIDDVYIQGIEGYPNWWRNSNFGTYNESSGTQGQGGFDGWVDYTQVTNPISVGVGNKLWEWDQFYVPTLTIINKGAPTIGNGGDETITGTETITFPVSFTPSSMDGGGWNFYANPYPCELDWNALEFTHSGISGGAVYIWNPGSAQYGVYDGSSSVNGVTQYIASGQGFFVKANSGSATISVTENAKSTADGNSFLRVADEPFASLKLKIESDNNNIDETVVTFKSYATDGYDPDFDAIKLSGGWINLSTKMDDNLLVAINSMGPQRGVQKVKLNIDPYYYGNYSLTFPEIKNFKESAIIYLKDNLLDKSMIINSSNKYDFAIDQNNPSTFGDDRFELQLLSPLKFSFDNVLAKAGQEFVVPVYADNIADIISTQLGLGWDADVLSFVGIEESGDYEMNDFDLGNVESGKLIFTSSSDSPVDLPDGTQLFSIRFRAMNGHPQAQLHFEKQSMKITAINDIDMPFNTKDLLLDIMQNRFISGSVASYAGDPIMDVTVVAEGDDNVENITDNIGTYSLDTYEQSNYLIFASKVDDYLLNEVVTTSDIIISRRHILGIEELESPYQWIAADVNASNSISALDLVEMRKVVLGIEESFQSGLDWLIIPGVYDLSEDPFNFETNLDVSLIDQDLDLDFKGVKVGDVDNSWVSLSNGRVASGSLAVSLEHLSLKDETIEIPVIVKDFKDISGYQFTITWDPNQLVFSGLEHQALEGYFNEQLVGDGVLTTLWDESNGRSIELDNGSTLFVMRFTVKDNSVITVVELNSAVTEAIAFNGQLNSLSIASTSANVNLDELRNGKLELLQNVPNPFDFSTTIEFKIPKEGKARLSVINLLGEIVYLHEQEYQPGVYQISWDRNQSSRTLTSGVYLYRLESNGEEVVKRMVIE